MGWWEGNDQTRILIAPESGAGRFLSLRHPKSGEGTCYILADEKLQELHWFKLPYGSWFVGDYVCRDGSVYYATPVDPVFIMLPIFEEARMKKGGDPGKFRQLDEILFVDGYPGYQQLLSIAENHMQIVCEIKEIGSIKFFRLDDSKVLAWLLHKVYQLKSTLPTLDKNYAARAGEETLADAVSIIGEYLRDEPWMKHLCENLNLNLPGKHEKEAPVAETLSAATNLTSPTAFQKNNGNGKRLSNSGRQAKKAKVETESRNIREMFSRASRKG